MSCCTNTYNLGCFNNCSIIAVGLCLTSGTYNGVFTYGNISTTITVTAIENEPFLFDLSLLNENATFTLVIYDENENQITLTIDSVDYDCFKVKTQVDSVKVTQGTIIGCTPMCKEIYDPNDENTAVLFTVAVDGTTITGDGTVGNPLIAIGGGGGGGIESIVAGDNITVDNTDPLNPIVSASSLLFPNGREIITSSRDFQQSDEGKILIVVGNNIALTMPDASIWTEVGIPIGLKFMQGYTGCSYEATHGFPIKVLQLSNDGEFITLFTGEYLGKSSVGSIADMQVNSDDGIVTLNKYLYDQSQNAIPLSGTVSGSPVTGDIEFSDNSTLYQGTDEATKLSIQFKSGQIEQKAKDNTTSSDTTVTTNPLAHDILVNDVTTGYAGFLNVSADGIHINSSNPESSGLFAGVDFTANAKNNPNAYVQYAGLSALRFVISKSQSVSDGDFDAYAGTAYILPEVASNDKVINLQTAQDGDIYRFVNVAQPTNNWITSVLFFLSDGTSSNTVPAEKITVIQYDAAASVFHLISSQ